MSSKARFKLLTRLAQLASAPASPDETNTPQSTPTTITVAPPPAFTASQVWGWMTSVYNPPSINTIDSLCSLLNTALHYSSNGQFNFQTLRNDGFQVDSSGVPSVDTKNLLNLSMLIYRTLLGSGNKPAQKLTPDQIHGWTKQVNSSQAFLNLSQLNPTGVVAQKIPAGLKNTILNYLRYLDMYNP